MGLNAQKFDAIERQIIVCELKAATANRPDNQLINWEEHDLELQAGSSLHQVHTPGQILFHGITKASDVGYASDAQVGGAQGQKLDVVPLLNLATGFLRITDDGVTPQYHASAKTFENADSLAVAAMLLSQLFTDKNAYPENMTIMSQAVSANRNRAITSPVVITLNKA